MSNILNLNGSCLTLASLALIAEMLERGGDVVVSNCAVRSDAPVAKSLGFEVFRDEQDGYWETRVEQIEPRSTAMKFWAPAPGMTPCANCGTTSDTPAGRLLSPTLCARCYNTRVEWETPKGMPA